MEGTPGSDKCWAFKFGPLELYSALTRSTLTTLGSLLLAPATMPGGPSSCRGTWVFQRAAVTT